MSGNASAAQLLELGSLLVRNVPKDMPEDAALGWISKPGRVRNYLHRMLTQSETVNILCVTKRNDTNRDGVWGGGVGVFHRLITGQAAIATNFLEIGKMVVALGTKVDFQGVRHNLVGIRSGLDGMSVVLKIAVADGRYTTWDLYTDIPTDPEKYTHEMICKKAAEAIQRNAYQKE